jgi:hypothetical protein
MNRFRYRLQSDRGRQALQEGNGTTSAWTSVGCAPYLSPGDRCAPPQLAPQDVASPGSAGQSSGRPLSPPPSSAVTDRERHRLARRADHAVRGQRTGGRGSGQSSAPRGVLASCSIVRRLLLNSRRHEGSGRQAQKLWTGDPQTPRIDRKPNHSNSLCARLSEGHFGPVTGRCWTGGPVRNSPDRQMRRCSPGRHHYR